MRERNLIFIIIIIAALIEGGLYVTYKQSHTDTTPPVLTMGSQNIWCRIAATDDELLRGVTAVDDDGTDLTDQVMVNDIRLKQNTQTDVDSSSETGTKQFEVSYAVFDDAGNSTFASRNLTFTDYHAPHFKLADRLVFNSVSAVNFSDLIGAEDCIDGDISSQVSINVGEDFLNAVSAGTYTCTAEVTNSVGDTASLPLTFVVQDSSSAGNSSIPDIYLTDYLVYLNQGDGFDSQQYLSSIKIDSRSYYLTTEIEKPETEIAYAYAYGYMDKMNNLFMYKSNITVTGDLDMNTVGIYTVDYSYTNPEDGTKGTTALTVVVG